MSIKDAQDALSRVSEHGRSLSGRLEDLVFRAQRIARALKQGAQVPDALFGRDLRDYRLDIRNYGVELGGLPSLLPRVAQSSRPEPGAAASVGAVGLLCEQVRQSLLALEDQCQLANQHIRGAEYKSDMGHLFLEIHSLVLRVRDLPPIVEKIASLARTAPPGAPSSEPADPAPKRRAAVPLRSLARFIPAPPPASPPAQPDGPGPGLL